VQPAEARSALSSRMSRFCATASLRLATRLARSAAVGAGAGATVAGAGGACPASGDRAAPGAALGAAAGGDAGALVRGGRQQNIFFKKESIDSTVAKLLKYSFKN
jgi:hypothetical protein